MNGLKDLLGLSYDKLASSKEFIGIRLPDIERIEDQSYLSIHDRGVSFVFPDNRTIGAVQLHSQGHEGFSGYADALPAGLSFNMSREEVQKLLGKPDRSGEEGQVPFLGHKPAWDSFLEGNMRIHVEYDFGQTALQLVTITAM